MTNKAVEFVDVRKRYKDAEVLKGIRFDINEGEFLTLLGPSGCGKTTLLRMLAGFETPSSGDIRIGGQSMKTVPPHRRPIGMVFQNLALFPHLSVGGNIEYGLRARGVRAPELRREVDAALDLVGLSGFSERRIGQLSGGQRQRVALARSLVAKPKVLLLDEPFSALDLKLRQQMQIEIKDIQRRIGTTFVFVTHDQDEALAMSDRIAIMNAGVVEQLASAEDIYHRPSSAFVARFVGETNYIPCTVLRSEGGNLIVRANAWDREFAVSSAGSNSFPVGVQAALCVRPEGVSLAPAFAQELLVNARVTARRYSGSSRRIELNANGIPLIARVESRAGHDDGIQVDADVCVHIDPAYAVLVPAVDIK